MKYTLLFLLPLIGIMACQEETINVSNADKGLAYYPLNVGKYWTYTYDSVIFDNKGIDKYTFSGYIKEEITEVISKSDAETKYKLTKYWKKKVEDNWKLTDVESITQTDSKIIKTEENLPFIKMIFPNNNNESWNGNAMFDENIVIMIYGEPLKIYQAWKYKIENKGASIDFDNKKYEGLTVVQVDNSRDVKPSIFDKRYSVEYFAKDIGMVRKEMKIYDTQNPKTGLPWEDYAQKGYSLVQQLIEHN
jgi:hypothetical protein